MSRVVGSFATIYVMMLLIAIPASIDMGASYLLGALVVLGYTTLALTGIAFAFLVGENIKRLIDRKPLTFRFWEGD